MQGELPQLALACELCKNRLTQAEISQVEMCIFTQAGQVAVLAGLLTERGI